MTNNTSVGLLLGYVRTSKPSQDPQLQINALLKTGMDSRHIFQDQMSGCSGKREGLEKVLSFAQTGDTLIIWKLDRLGRSLKELIHLFNFLEEKGVSVKSLTESIDTTTPAGRLVFHMFAALAEFERGIIRERTQAGLDAAREQGRLIGRPPVISEEQTKHMIEMRNAGKSYGYIAKIVNVSVPTVWRYVNRYYEKLENRA